MFKLTSLYSYSLELRTEKQQIPMLCLLVWHDRGSNPRFTELDAASNKRATWKQLK